MNSGEITEILRAEYCKMRKSRSFKLCLLAGVVFVILHSIYVYKNLYMQNEQRLLDITNTSNNGALNTEWYEMGILQGWIGTEPFSGYNNIFFLVFPLLAAVPYGVSLYYEQKKGLTANIEGGSMRQYYTSKYLMTFLSGGISVSTPLVVSLIISACYLPAVGTDPLALQTMITNYDMFADQFFDLPVLYALIFIIIDFIVGGLFACMTLVISGWCSNGIIALIFPTLLNAVLTRIVFNDEGFEGIRSFVPGYFINPSPEITVCTPAGVVGSCTIMGLVLIGLYVLNVHASCSYK
ncbi:MAG: hypothetical protein K2G45_12360 [Lachnospiraceae bacterium]|nr:hypothetical protein [Lachnospiraceae bacterium]